MPTDCPTRERLGWTGDYQIFAPTAALMYDIDGFSRKWLRAVRDDQYDDGSLAMFSPDCERMKANPANPQRIGGGSAGWGDAAVAVPWTLYEHYGDYDVLQENWPLMRSLGRVRARSGSRAPPSVSRSERNPRPLRTRSMCGTDPFTSGSGPSRRTPRQRTDGGGDMADAYQALLTADQGDVGTAFLYRSTRQLANVAGILGHHDDASHYGAVADLVREAWRAEFLGPDGRTARDTQASYVRAIEFDLIPEDLLPAASGRLVELIERAGGHLTTGFLSTAALLPVLADTGHLDLAYRLLTQRGVPSWSEMLARGATTFWENWDAVDEDGNVNPGSLNHYAKGAAVRFLHTHVAGLRQAPGSTGWREVVVSPNPAVTFTQASTRLDTPHGTIEVRWAVVDDDLVVTTATARGCDGGTLFCPTQAPSALPSATTTVKRLRRDRSISSEPSGTR